MQDIHRDVLRACHIKLIKELDISAILNLKDLDKILGSYSVECIKSSKYPTLLDKRREFLRSIQGRGPTAFAALLKIFREIGQQHLATKLEEKEKELGNQRDDWESSSSSVVTSHNNAATNKEFAGNTGDSVAEEARFLPPFVSEFHKNFEMISHLGSGGFADVFKAMRKLENHFYAVKRISLSDNDEEKEEKLREVSALVKLHHIGIVRYYHWWIEEPPSGWQEENDKALIGNSFSQDTTFTRSYTNTGDGTTSTRSSTNTGTNSTRSSINTGAHIYLYIQMELCMKDTLKEWLADNPEREWLKIVDIYEQTVSAVNYIHAEGMMHRDLKLSNIFFASNGNVKVGDFGLVRPLEVPDCASNDLHVDTANTCPEYTHQVGTALYMSPEQVSSKRYTHKVDIFALGIILFELCSTFTTEMERIQTLKNVRKEQPTFPQTFMKEFPEIHEFLLPLLSHDPEKRPEAKDILQLPR